MATGSKKSQERLGALCEAEDLTRTFQMRARGERVESGETPIVIDRIQILHS
jgi:hypothetical protein